MLFLFLLSFFHEQFSPKAIGEGLNKMVSAVGMGGVTVTQSGVLEPQQGGEVW